MPKYLFILFSDEVCKLNHAFLYALDLEKNGFEVKMIIEGTATKCFTWLDTNENFKNLFTEAKEKGLIIGTCDMASHGCSTGKNSRNVVDIAKTERVDLLNDLNGHAGITNFLKVGFLPVIF